MLTLVTIASLFSFQPDEDMISALKKENAEIKAQLRALKSQADNAHKRADVAEEVAQEAAAKTDKVKAKIEAPQPRLFEKTETWLVGAGGSTLLFLAQFLKRWVQKYVGKYAGKVIALGQATEVLVPQLQVIVDSLTDASTAKNFQDFQADVGRMAGSIQKIIDAAEPIFESKG